MCVARRNGHVTGESFETGLPARVIDATNGIELNLVFGPSLMALGQQFRIQAGGIQLMSW